MAKKKRQRVSFPSRTLYYLFRFLLDALILGGIALVFSYVDFILLNAHGNHPALIGISIIFLGVLIIWLDEQLARMR